MASAAGKRGTGAAPSFANIAREEEKLRLAKSELRKQKTIVLNNIMGDASIKDLKLDEKGMKSMRAKIGKALTLTEEMVRKVIERLNKQEITFSYECPNPRAPTSEVLAYVTGLYSEINENKTRLADIINPIIDRYTRGGGAAAAGGAGGSSSNGNIGMNSAATGGAGTMPSSKCGVDFGTAFKKALEAAEEEEDEGYNSDNSMGGGYRRRRTHRRRHHRRSTKKAHKSAKAHHKSAKAHHKSAKAHRKSAKAHRKSAKGRRHH